MFDLTKQERKALLFVTIFIATGAVLKVLPFAIEKEPTVYRQKAILHEENSKVNINTAGVEDLVKLKGVGSTIALSIVEFRKKNGSFKSVEELLNVKGIGAAKLSAIKKDIEL